MILQILEALVKRFSLIDDLMKIIDGRILAEVADLDIDSLPCIVYTSDNYKSLITHSGTVGVTRFELKITAISRQFIDCQKIGDIITKSIDGINQPIADGYPFTMNSKLMNQQSGFDSENQIYNLTITYSIQTFG